ERAAGVMRMDVPGCDRLDAEVLGEVAQKGESPRVPSLERPLELDEEALPAERPRQARRRVRVEEAEATPSTTGEADEALAQLRHRFERHRRRQRLSIFASWTTRPCMRSREQAAEVHV